jgi:hypothetical protein
VLETLTCLSKPYTRSSSWRPPLSLITYPQFPIRSSCSTGHRSSIPPLQLLHRSFALAAHRPPLGRSAAPGPWRSRTPGVQHSSSRRPGPRRSSSSSSCSTARALAAPAVSTAVPRCPCPTLKSALPLSHPGGQVASHPDIQAQVAATPSSKHQGIIYLFVLSN